MDSTADGVTPTQRPLRAIWEREPVRVVNATFTLLAGVNAILMAAGVYDGGAAAAVTGVIALLAAFVNELFTRAEVVPLKPLEDLADGLPRTGPPTAGP
jgi:hypothetical protein